MWFSARHYQVGKTDRPMSVVGHKQTFSEVCAVSALPPKADIYQTPKRPNLCIESQLSAPRSSSLSTGKTPTRLRRIAVSSASLYSLISRLSMTL